MKLFGVSIKSKTPQNGLSMELWGARTRCDKPILYKALPHLLSNYRPSEVLKSKWVVPHR